MTEQERQDLKALAIGARRNAAYIAAVSPTVVLDLIADVERLHAEASIGEDYRAVLRGERDAALAEVARLQQALDRTRAFIQSEYDINSQLDHIVNRALAHAAARTMNVITGMDAPGTETP